MSSERHAGARDTAEKAAVGLLLVAVGTCPWKAVAAGELMLAHVALAAAGAVLGVLALRGDRPIRAPQWVWVLGAAIGVVTVVSVVWPVAPTYYADRFLGGVFDAVADPQMLAIENIRSALKWLVAAVFLPLTVCLTVARRPRLLVALTDAWICGTAISAAVGITDAAGLTRISVTLIPVTNAAGRQAGLTGHSTHLAFSIIVALPLVVWRLVRTGRASTRTVHAVAGLVMVAGLVTTGSRAGIAGAVIAVVAALVLDPRGRRLVPAVSALVALGSALVLVVAPALVARVAEDLRLAGAPSAQTSDEIRWQLTQQALADFAHSPLWGVGLDVSEQAHNIYLQLVASGGVILLLGFGLAQLGFLSDAWTARHRMDGLGGALVACGVTFLAIGAVQWQLTDVFIYVPFALAAGLWAIARDEEASVPADVCLWEEIRS